MYRDGAMVPVTVGQDGNTPPRRGSIVSGGFITPAPRSDGIDDGRRLLGDLDQHAGCVLNQAIDRLCGRVLGPRQYQRAGTKCRDS